MTQTIFFLGLVPLLNFNYRLQGLRKHHFLNAALGEWKVQVQTDCLDECRMCHELGWRNRVDLKRTSSDWLSMQSAYVISDLCFMNPTFHNQFAFVISVYFTSLVLFKCQQSSLGGKLLCDSSIWNQVTDFFLYCINTFLI